MDILPTTANRQTNSAGSAPGVTTDRTAITADFETFLTLLTTQLKNQDPLNPIESTEYATQLATFSSVEQQVRTNELLESLTSDLGTMNLGQLGGWIGMDAMADMPAVFTGDPLTVQATPADGADRMEMVVTDVSGRVVQRLPIPLSDAAFNWTGENLQGQVLPPGVYQLQVENWSGETLLRTNNANIRATIEEAQLIDGEVFLTMEGGMRVSADDILGLRRSPGA